MSTDIARAVKLRLLGWAENVPISRMERQEIHTKF